VPPAPPPTLPPARERALDDAAAALSAHGDSVSLVQLVEAWSAIGTPTARARLAQGRAFQSLRLLDRAMARAQEALDEAPDAPDALRLLAEVYLDRGWPVKARKPLATLQRQGADVARAWDRAHAPPERPDPNARERERDADADALLALAESFLCAGSFLRAKGLLERVRRAAPSNARARELLWAVEGDFRHADLDALVRRAQAFAAAAAADASDEPEHTETLGVDARELFAEEAAPRFPTLFKHAAPSAVDPSEDEHPDVTQASALLRPLTASDPDAEERRGDTQILLVIRPGETASARSARTHRRRADTDDTMDGMVDLQRWQRSMGMPAPVASDLDDVPDEKWEEEDADLVVVTRAEARHETLSDETAPRSPIEVIDKHPTPEFDAEEPTAVFELAAVSGTAGASIPGGNDGRASRAAPALRPAVLPSAPPPSPGTVGRTAVPRPMAASDLEDTASAEPPSPTTAERSGGRSLALAALAFAVLILGGLALLQMGA
jgi:tetratricopeptide (TPR) repeat protein